MGKLDRILEILNTGAQVATLAIPVAGVAKAAISGVILGVQRARQSDGTVTYQILLEEGEENREGIEKDWDDLISLVRAERPKAPSR